MSCYLSLDSLYWKGSTTQQGAIRLQNTVQQRLYHIKEVGDCFVMASPVIMD